MLIELYELYGGEQKFPYDKFVNCLNSVVKKYPKNNVLDVLYKNKKDESIKICTFNIQAFETAEPKLIAQFIDTLDAELICVQEDLENTILESKYYKRISFCKGEKYGSTILGNSVYVRKENIGYITKTLNVDITKNCTVPRCSVLVEYKNIRMANVHLCGGRYDDPEYENLKDVKERELGEMLKHNPNIILGDFNGEEDVSSIKNYYLYKNLSGEEKKLFEKYYSSGHSFLKDNKYKTKKFGITSKFGGTPDWMYYDSTIKIVNYQVIDTIFENKLSDHKCIVIEIKRN